MCAVFHNPQDQRPDREVYRDDLRLAELAEPLGFDSLWTVEHHFTDYCLAPNPFEFLAYMAGRTERIQLGTMVVVLPWWSDPIRVAEQASVLDHLSNGRFVLGFGRGAARHEFEGFGVPMEESRQRFLEGAEMVLQGLERGYCEYDGQWLKQPRKDIRPKPFKSFAGRVYGAAVSPESSEIMAKLGLGMLIIPQKSWPAIVDDLERHRAAFRAARRIEPPPCIVSLCTFCSEKENHAREIGQTYVRAQAVNVVRHYEVGGAHFARIKGYEAYTAGELARSAEALELQINLQVCGTPEQCREKIVAMHSQLGFDTFVGVFSFAGLPYAEAERSIRLFAREVLPALQGLRTHQRSRAPL
jgi:alkanesulfonate monooxygenase SsuD/methylene tetrahydromethanopterin reductase-like flavin-dependent oxidoreductase (luciferase family)